MGQVCFNDDMLHSSISYHQKLRRLHREVKPLVALYFYVSTEFKSLFGFNLWSVLCTSDDIIRGKESDVASYMIHVGLVHLHNGYRAVV
jgi:hypothetical protein